MTTPSTGCPELRGNPRTAEWAAQTALSRSAISGSVEKEFLLLLKLTSLLVASFMTLQCPARLALLGQQAPIEDGPSAEPAGNLYNQLPIDEADRATLRDAIRVRNYGRAEALLAEEIERNPKSQLLLTTVGSIFFRDGKYLNCAVAMKKAEALALLPHRDRFTLALSYIIMNHRDWARPELEGLAKADPRDPLYPYWLGRVDFDEMRYKAAEANLQKALNLDAKFMKAYDNLGLTYEALGQYDDATRIYQQAIVMNRSEQPPSPWPPLNLGTLLVKLGKLREGEAYLDESLKYDPHFPKAHYEMGVLFEKQDKDDQASKELLEAAKNDPTFPEPHYLLGRIYLRHGDKPKADVEWQTFQKLKQVSPKEHSH
jgi:Tfp pilus assembly protein PilF